MDVCMCVRWLFVGFEKGVLSEWKCSFVIEICLITACPSVPHPSILSNLLLLIFMCKSLPPWWRLRLSFKGGQHSADWNTGEANKWVGVCVCVKERESERASVRFLSTCSDSCRVSFGFVHVCKLIRNLTINKNRNTIAKNTHTCRPFLHLPPHLPLSHYVRLCYV